MQPNTKFNSNTNNPSPEWKQDLSTDVLTKFRSLPIIEDDDPYIDSDYNRDTYWDDQLYDQQQLNFHQQVLRQENMDETDELIDEQCKLINALMHLWEPNEHFKISTNTKPTYTEQP